MVDIDDLVEKFKSKSILFKETADYKNSIEPVINTIFNEEFSDVFRKITESLNEKLGFSAVNFKTEGKNRFFVEGRYHRVIFLTSKIEIVDNVINTNIIPLCIWKGVTKHLSLVSFAINPDSDEIKWNLPFSSVEEYAKNLFGKLAEDEDFFM